MMIGKEGPHRAPEYHWAVGGPSPHGALAGTPFQSGRLPAGRSPERNIVLFHIVNLIGRAAVVTISQGNSSFFPSRPFFFLSPISLFSAALPV